MPQTVVHITDTHLFEDSRATLKGINPEANLQRVIEQACADRPDAVLVTGDLVHDESLEAYQKIQRYLERFDCPVYCLPGNHDSPRLMAKVLNWEMKQGLSHDRLGDWHLILVNSWSEGCEGGRISDETLSALNRLLSTIDSEACVLATHHQPVPVCSLWIDQES